jgi:predicted transcriptional regulator
MPSDLQISILFDIASNGGAGLAPDKLLDLMDLIADGYVEAGDSGEFYKLTEKGQRLLSERGGGANES